MASSVPRVRPSPRSLVRARQQMLGAALARLDVRRGIVILLTLITILMGPNGLLTNLPVAHGQAPQAALSSGKPNRFDPTKDAQSKTHAPQSGRSDPNWRPSPPQPLTHPVPPSMQPGSLKLIPGQPALFIDSNGRLEVDIPPNAVTASDLAQAGGTLTLQITPLAGPSGGSAGGWGVISLGMYLLQVVDVHGQQLTHGLRAALTFKLHYGARESALDLRHAFVVLNGALPAGTHPATPPGSSKPTFGAGMSQATTLDSAHQTLTVTLAAASPSTTLTWDTYAPVATFGAPDPFNVSLNAGALTAGYPINVPSGPGGFTPPVQLGYSSESVSEQHSPQGAAPWVGEGWNLGLGSISWAEHNVTAGSGTNTWQDSWQLSDPFGTSAELIPPSLTVSTFNDDTGNSITPSPITWHTAPETYARIISYTGPLSLGGTAAPCFRVFLPNGIMEEFGCTSDSLVYYVQQNGSGVKYYISSWMLDLITDRHGNQVHLTYQRDMETGAGSTSYPRDSQLATIEYDSPGCLNVQTACTGSAWAPLMRVNFVASHSPTRLTNTPSGCNTGSNLRCDDPLDLSGSGGLVAPSVQTTYVLNDIQVQVRTSGTGSWNTLSDYQLSYEQSGPSTITDPSTGKSESVAGMLDLTQIQAFGDDGSTSLPPRVFSYTSLTQHYEDDAYHPNPSNNCGPSWNSSACLLWSESYAGNSRYLATADNGLGLHQTFSWAEGRNNTHGVNGGGSNTANPLYCDGRESQGYPCSQADDQNWSHVVLTQEQDQVIRLTQNGQGGQQTNTPVTSTTSYSYLLTYPLPEQPCSDCVAGMYWGNQNDADYLDYYNGKFMGFTQATVTHPDGSVDVHLYVATRGWGLYDAPGTSPNNLTCYAPNPCHADPWWTVGNAEHGHEYEVDSYDTNGTTLLSKTHTVYLLQCPPSGVNGTGTTSYGNFNGNLVSELDHNNPVAACAIYTSEVDTYTYDGSTASNVPHRTTTYSYDSYGRQTSRAVTINNGGATGSPTTLIDATNYVWNDAVTATATSATGTYLIDFPARTSTQDANGTQYSCTYTAYDGLGFQTGAQPNFTGAGAVTMEDHWTTGCDLTAQASAGYSSTQGKNQWWYQYSTDGEHTFQNMTYDSTHGWWQGSESYCLVGSNWQHPGSGVCDSVRTWIAPGSGAATLTANGPITVAAGCSGNTSGTEIRVLKNGVQIWPSSGWQVIPNGGSFTFPSLPLTLATGDQLQFVLAHVGSTNYCDSTTWDPMITPGGLTAQASAGYSSTQGQNQWWYQYSTDGERTFQNMTYDSTHGWWQGSESYCLVGSNWQHPGSGVCDSVRTWIAPGSGAATLTANGPITVAAGCSGNTSGTEIRVLKNGVQIWPSSGWQVIPNGGSFTFPSLPLTLATGDQLQFVLAHVGSTNYCDSTTWDPIITAAWNAIGHVMTTSTSDQWGNPLTTTDPDANAGISGHTGCTIGSTQYTTCTAYDTTFDVLPVSTTNALNQTASIGYTQNAGGGFGLWPMSATDVNGQTTTVTYDALGRPTSQTLPGETTGLTTTSTTYTDFCAASGAQSPCVEIDTTQRLNSTTTVTVRAFYDGFGRLVETRAPGPNGQDVVRYRYYDPNGRVVFDSIQYFVTAYTGAPGAAAYSIPDSTQPGTSASYPSHLSGSVTDALSNTATGSSSVICSPSGVSDTACYVQRTTIDPLGHKQSSFTDALGREIYDQRYTGNSPSTYAVYATTQYTYDYRGDLTQILHPDGTTKTTFQYDMVGRQIGMTDPDRGTESYVYDQNGNVTQTTDARGSAGTTYAGYDGLNRQLWRNTTNSPTGAYITYSYDSTANGNKGVGRLTGESFTGGGPSQSLSGSYSTVYDVRGQVTQATLTVGGTNYPIQASYNDAGQMLTQTYPNGDMLTASYSSQGWLAGLTLQQGSTQTTLLGNLNYTGASGAAGLPSSANLNGGTYTQTASYDLLLRPTDTKVTRSSDQTTLFEEVPSYDSASRITGETTTLPQGTDVQQFCYDEQNRLTWAGAMGTPPCTGTAITPGSLTTAQYTTTYTYDTLGRLTSGPQGSYTYGASAHIHAATAIGTSYTASYDAAGNMTCRAPTSATTCAGGTPTGAQLSYDNEGRLSAWQNAPSSPTATAAYLYNGEGSRVEQQTAQNGTTTTTVYVGGLEEVTTSGTTTTTKTYYGGMAMAVNGVLSYLVADGLGTITEALDTGGNVQASQLYAPYGGVRYSSGTMPTLFGFTGQRQDALTGLYYFGARYYDPVAGQFISADTMLLGGGYNPWGLSRYAYVTGNPVSFTDPTGHKIENPDEIGGGGGEGGLGGGGGTPASPYAETCNCVPEGVSNLGEQSYSSWDQVNTDGQTVEWEEDGNIEVKNPDGTGEIVTPEGDVIKVDENGNQVEEDGQAITVQPTEEEQLTQEKSELLQQEAENAKSGNTGNGNGNGDGNGGGNSGSGDGSGNGGSGGNGDGNGFAQAQQAADGHGAGVYVPSAGDGFHSGGISFNDLPEGLQKVIDDNFVERYSGQCAEIAFCNALLSGEILTQPGQTIEAYLWQVRGLPPCGTCDPALRYTAQTLQIIIRIFEQGWDSFTYP